LFALEEQFLGEIAVLTGEFVEGHFISGLPSIALAKQDWGSLDLECVEC
jgi:hypothetical protein